MFFCLGHQHFVCGFHACVSTDGAWARTCVFLLTARDRWRVDLTLPELRRVGKKAFAVLVFLWVWNCHETSELSCSSREVVFLGLELSRNNRVVML